MYGWYSMADPNVSTAPTLAMECGQCLPLSDVQLKGKHCQKFQCHIGSSQVMMVQILYSVFTFSIAVSYS